MSDLPVSRRIAALRDTATFREFFAFREEFDFDRRRTEPGVLDFTIGDPHEMPMADYVDALRACLEPENELWFAYKTSEPDAQAAAAASLRRAVGVPFEPEDMLLTTGGFSAIALAIKTVGYPGDEVVFNLPPWFLYEPLVVEAGLTPIKTRVDPETHDLDLAAIAGAITPHTRIVIVNTPNNPTGRIYPPETLRRLARLLDDASAANGRRIYLISDEAYNRIVFDGARFHSPAEFYPHTLLAYSYGKTLLAPGQRIGYLALPPSMPEREAVRDAAGVLQIALGWIFPNALLQHALPRLEMLSIDVARLQQKRDRLIDALRSYGYGVNSPEGTFYLYPRSPIADDRAFAHVLNELDVLAMPGVLFETPGYFRLSLTASEEMIERGLPRFAEAFARATAG